MSARPSLPTKAAALFGFSDILHIETFSTNESNINFWHVGIRHTDSLPKTGPDTLNPRPPLDAPVSRLPGDLRCWVAGLSRTRRCARLDRDGGSCSGRRTQWQEWSARIGRLVPAVGIWSPCRIRGGERRRAPAPRSGDALDCRRQSGAEERGFTESDGALRDAMARGAQELRCSCRPVWPVDRPCARPKATVGPPCGAYLITYRARLPGSRPKMSATSPRGRNFGETGTSPRSVARKSLRRPASPPPPPVPVFFGLALHRRRSWVLHLEPGRRAAAPC